MDSVKPKKSLTEETYDILLDAICAGELSPGERLMQDDLAARLNVSRQPVNAAISILKTDGLVEDNGRRGVTVSRMDSALFASIYEFRAVVEPFAMRLACERVDDAWEDEARGVLAAGQAALNAGDMAALVTADTRFHEMIYRWSGNEAIAISMRSNWNHTRRAMSVVLREPGLPGQSWRDHSDIVDAIFADNCPAAEEIMARHLSAAKAKLEERLAVMADGDTAGD